MEARPDSQVVVCPPQGAPRKRRVGRESEAGPRAGDAGGEGLGAAAGPSHSLGGSTWSGAVRDVGDGGGCGAPRHAGMAAERQAGSPGSLGVRARGTLLHDGAVCHGSPWSLNSRFLGARFSPWSRHGDIASGRSVFEALGALKERGRWETGITLCTLALAGEAGAAVARVFTRKLRHQGVLTPPGGVGLSLAPGGSPSPWAMPLGLCSH